MDTRLNKKKSAIQDSQWTLLLFIFFLDNSQCNLTQPEEKFLFLTTLQIWCVSCHIIWKNTSLTTIQYPIYQLNIWRIIHSGENSIFRMWLYQGQTDIGFDRWMYSMASLAPYKQYVITELEPYYTATLQILAFSPENWKPSPADSVLRIQSWGFSPADSVLRIQSVSRTSG